MKDIDSRHMIFGCLFLISTRLETISTSYFDEITAKQWFLLAILTTFFETPPTISELAQQMGSSHQNVKQIAIKLEKKGFLRIEKDEYDNRANRIIITDKTMQFGKNNEEKDNTFLENLFSIFNDKELALFSEYLQRLEQSLTLMQKK